MRLTSISGSAPTAISSRYSIHYKRVRFSNTSMLTKKIQTPFKWTKKAEDDQITSPNENPNHATSTSESGINKDKSDSVTD